MAIFEFKAGVSAEVKDQAVLEAALGNFEKLNKILGKGGQRIPYDVKINVSGVAEVKKGAEVTEQLTAQQRNAKTAIQAMTRAQEGSLTSLRQTVNSLKQQRDQLASTSAAWAGYNTQVKAAQTALSQAQGVQAGSLVDLRNQREELKKLRDATARFPSGPGGGDGGQSWNDLNYQIRQIDGQINKVTPGFSSFFSTLSRIATVQAGFIALTSALSAIGGVVNSYVSRTKQLEAFGLALKNVGLTQAETSAAFKEATAIATRLGAPVQQVEKSYQRMVPALRAVGADSKKTSKFIESITARTQTLGLSTEESGRLFEAFAQVLSKGKLQAEELNQQISELDGAFRTQLADALGVSVEALTKLVEAGKITAPVFVEAVTKMSNGVEELQKRIKNGTATIQQLQNQIANISVATLSQIGGAIEPGIKSFLKLSNTVAAFFLEFSKTEVFKTLVIIFNQSAKGVEVFVSALLKVLDVVLKILQPIATAVNVLLGFGDAFGGVIGLAIIFGSTLLLIKGAVAGLAVLTTATTALRAFGAAMAAAGGAQNKLVGTGTVGALGGVRQGAENARAAIVGMGRGLANSAASFVGFNSAVTSAGQGVSAASAAVSKAPSTFRAFSQAATQTTAAAANLGNTAGQTSVRYAQFRAEVLKLNPVLRTAGLACLGAGQGINALGAAAGTVGGQIKQGIGSALVGLVNPVTVLIVLFGILSQLFTANAKGADRIKQAYAGVLAPLNEEFDRAAASQKKAAQGSEALAQSVKKTIPAVKKSADTAGASAFAWGALTVGLVVLTGVLAGAAVASGGLATPLVAASGSATAAAAAMAGFGGAIVITTGHLVAAGIVAAGLGGVFLTVAEASKQLEKQGVSQALVKNYQDVRGAVEKVSKQIGDLGGKVGQVDFSKFAEGSKNLGELGLKYRAAAKTIREKIEADKELLKTENAAKDRNQANIDALKAQIAANQVVLGQMEASAEAVSNETATRIAFGRAVDAATVSVEDLNKAEKISNEIIDISAIKARTDALQKYGKLQSDQARLGAANLAIETAASGQRLALAQTQLKLLDLKKAKVGSLDLEEQASARALTNTVLTETEKQAQAQNQLGQAITEAFAQGIAKVRELAGIYGQVTQGLKTGFDGLTNGLNSGIQASLGLINSVIEVETAGMAENSAAKKAMIMEGLRAQAQANELEREIGQFKLDVQNRIAQNEARIAQIRLEAEAQIAEKRGQTGIANAYREAAGAQDQIISGLQKQYEIESRVLDINKQQKDQALISRGIQLEGGRLSANTVAEQIGVQRVSLGEAKAGLSQLVYESKQLVTSLGKGATAASDMQVEIEETQTGQGEREAQAVAKAYKDAADNVKNLSEEMSKTGVSVDAFLKGMLGVKDVSAGIAKDIRETAAILGTGRAGGAPARATGGPVTAGQQYFVNDGGGREAFLSRTGKFSMLPAGRNLNWTAPSSGSIIPANYIDQYRKNSFISDLMGRNKGDVAVSSIKSNNASASVDSGNLAQRVASAMSSSGTTQRITNNVTIQSQEPVTDASKIMTNVARMRLRSAGRI